MYLDFDGSILIDGPVEATHLVRGSVLKDGEKCKGVHHGAMVSVLAL